ncbi:MAG: hypothetical protein KDA57_04520 [Planctomycetales bacterium]|nr:hypothetical protein [Planctomycetales bacterium]
MPSIVSAVAAGLCACLLLPEAAVGAPAWPDSSVAQRLINQSLPRPQEPWDGGRFAQKNSRAATYAAVGLLWRDAAGDREAAVAALKGVIAMQYEDGPDSLRYGVWRRWNGETEVDPNWREFVGCGLILVLENFAERLPRELVVEIEAALLRAAAGAMQRDVGPGYSNIALMSAILLDYVGEHQGRQAIRQAGLAKAQAIYELFSEYQTFNEFNSPTYYGVDLMGLAMWRDYASTAEVRKWGRSMEAGLWTDIGRFYHAGMRNMCGPFSRSYGMDMTQYCSLVGLWIALAIEDRAPAPWPEFDGRKHQERYYAPVFALLRPSVPENVVPDLLDFTGPRFFERRFSRYRASVLVEEELMMGAAAIRPHQNEQQHLATIYWVAQADKPPGWILLTANNEGLVPTVANRSLQIRRKSTSTKNSIHMLAYAPGLDDSAIAERDWKLPGLHLAVQTAVNVSLKGVSWIEHRYYGPCLDIQYSVAAETPDETVVLSLLAKP